MATQIARERTRRSSASCLQVLAICCRYLPRRRESSMPIATEHSYQISPDWLPTPDAINALPEPLRRFIHDLETNADPAGMVRENWFLSQQVDALTVKLDAMKRTAAKKKR